MLTAGLLLAAMGGLLWIAGKLGLPLGGLPGDVRVEGTSTSFYFPVVTCIILSIVLTVILNLVGRMFGK